mgnify:CR=1 FL=1
MKEIDRCMNNLIKSRSAINSGSSKTAFPNKQNSPTSIIQYPNYFFVSLVIPFKFFLPP